MVSVAFRGQSKQCVEYPDSRDVPGREIAQASVKTQRIAPESIAIQVLRAIVPIQVNAWIPLLNEQAGTATAVEIMKPSNLLPSHNLNSDQIVQFLAHVLRSNTCLGQQSVPGQMRLGRYEHLPVRYEGNTELRGKIQCVTTPGFVAIVEFIR